jgi:hypothetical protein
MPSNHPLLRLPFPRGGYQLAVFLHITVHYYITHMQAPEYPPLRKGRLGGDDFAGSGLLIHNS